MMKTIIRHLWLLVPLALLTGCGEKEEDTAPSVDPETVAQFWDGVQQYYDDDPDFFQFKALEDLPSDLDWKDGSEQEEMGSPNAKKGGRLNYFINDFPRTLRLVGPDASGGFRSYMMDDNGGAGTTGMPLTSRHPNTLEPIPCIAREWAVDEDGKTVYFRIWEDATYSNGEPIVADDFFFIFYFMRSKYLEAPWYNDWYTTRYDRVVKYDDRTIAVTMAEAKPDIVYRAGSLIPIYRAFFDEFGEDYLKRYNWRFQPTAGPYEILEENIEKGRSITLTKVPNWWAADKPFSKYLYNVDEFHLQVIREPSKAFEIFLQGGVDFHRISLPEFNYNKLPDDHEKVQSGYIEKIKFYNDIPGPDWALRMNRMRAPLDNKDVRKGVAHALNWDLVIKEVFYGDYERLQSPGQGFGPFNNYDIEPYPFDPVKAREYFAKAGFEQTGPDGILVNGAGDRLQISVTTGYKRLEDVLTVLQQEARKAGLALQPEILEQTAAWKKADEKKHQINLAAINRSVEMYPRYWEMYHSYHALEEDGSIKTNTNNDTQTAIPELDKLIDQYRGSSDKQEMIELSQQILAILHEDAAFSPGFRKPWYRVAKWRWMRYPEDTFDFRYSGLPDEMRAFWIDEEMKAETLEAMKEDKTFEPVIKEFTDFKTN